MAYNQHLSERITLYLDRKKAPYRTMKMMGGLCFMVDNKMCVGINDDKLMARINPERQQEYLAMNGVSEMTFTKTPMKSFVYVDAETTDSEEGLAYWIDQCLEYNPLAKASKKKSKKAK